MSDEQVKELIGFIDRLKIRNKPKLKPVYTSDEKLRVNTGNTEPKSAGK